MNRLFALCLASLALLGAPALADCKNPKTHQEGTACAVKDAADAKKVMDAAFIKIYALPKIDKHLAKAAQTSFNAYVKDQCAFMGGLMSKGDKVQAAGFAAQCELKYYKERTALLQSSS